jgi:hypothetical protein
MKSTLILGALLCAWTIHSAVAQQIPVSAKLYRVLAEGAGRTVYSNRGTNWTLTCEDVRAIVNRLGEAHAIAAAQAYGAGDAQIEVARQCLTKKTRK